MNEVKKGFIKFLVDTGALKFGEFTLKSGRESPYFINTGGFHKGSDVKKLAGFYAATVKENLKDVTCIFGPAYKGIPLAATVVQTLADSFDMDISYSFNRKEAKDHGESGILVGKKIDGSDKIVILDDVISAGTSVRESFELLKTVGDPEVLGIVISVDRMEKGRGEKSAIQEVTKTFGVPVYPVVNIEEIISYAKAEGLIDEAMQQEVADYRASYGIIGT